MAEEKQEKTQKIEPFRTPKGVHDILPKNHEYHTYIKKVIRHRARQAGYRRISTPIFEYTELFTRSIGDESDIVSKEMYTFKDKKGRSLTLKPEGTAGVVRAYIQHGIINGLNHFFCIILNRILDMISLKKADTDNFGSLDLKLLARVILLLMLN